MIEVRATSVVPVDWKMRNGTARFLTGDLPAILHPGCSGIVVEIGPGVTEFAVGDEIYGFAFGLVG